VFDNQSLGQVISEAVAARARAMGRRRVLKEGMVIFTVERGIEDVVRSRMESIECV
jgi:hypothetical protein